MAFWIFKSNPKKYDLSGRLKEAHPIISHTVGRTKYKVLPGDTVFLWESGAKRGIKGVMLVLEEPCAMEELSSERRFWRDTAKASVKERRIVGALVRGRVDLTIEELKATTGLEELEALKQYHAPAVVYPVDTEDQGRILLDLVR
jgi:predicted RNA-binding protein with PUA-like domain